MYLEHFNLTEQPFSITPDPRFLYMSARHREALAHLLYGLGESGGFVQLTGEVGTGKTTICRCLLEQVPDNVDIAIVLNPKVTAEELLATVCDELGVEYPDEGASIKTLVDILTRYLLDAHARGRRTVLIIDEAQNLSADVLEQVRLLTNLETSTQKLLQIILIGQPELREMLSREDMRQLSQRITARYHLEPISREEAGAYIRHRLRICGSTQSLFSNRAVDRIHKLSEGIPRLINVLCDRSLLGTYVEGKAVVDHKVVGKASREVLDPGTDEASSGGSRLPLLAAGLVVALIAGAALVFQPWQHLQQPGMFAAQEDMAAAGDEMQTGLPGKPPKSAGSESETAKLQAEITPPPQSVELGELLQQAGPGWYRLAWKELFARWQVVLPESVKPDFCRYAREYGLHCMIGRGDWNAVRNFDRPAVLTLTREDSTRVPVFLQRMDGNDLELVINGEVIQMQTAQVGKYWYGDYVLFVSAPPGGRLFLRVGDRAEDVAWLREQFEVAQGMKIPSSDPMRFDPRLQRQVLAFQRARGLLPDGIVGKNTMLHLNSATNREDVPRLAGE